MEYEKLGDYCDITSSKRVFANQYVSDGIPFYRSREIIEKKESKDISEPLFISKELYDTFKRKFGTPKKGDLLLTSVGTLGIPYIVKDEVFYFKDGNLTWMKNFKDGLDSRYLYYWLNSKFGKESLIVRAIGSSQAALTIDILKKYKIFIPSIKTQNKIVDILSAYDDLIENNNRRIALLEKAAQELYKEWFVRFRFPGFEGAELENGFPKNWLQFRLGKKMTFVRGKSYSSADIQDGDKVLLSMNNIRPYGGFIRDFTRVYGGKYQDKHVIKHGDLLMSITDMTQDRRIIGYVGMFDSNRTDCIMSTHLMKIDTPIDHHFILNFFNVSGLSKMIAEFATGANVLGLTDSILIRIKAVLPPNDLIEQYGKTVKPYYDMIAVLKNKNDNLIKQRDLLLPRLMSGKLEV